MSFKKEKKGGQQGPENLSNKMLALAKLNSQHCQQSTLDRELTVLSKSCSTQQDQQAVGEVTDYTGTVCSSECIYGFGATFQHYFSSCDKG